MSCRDTFSVAVCFCGFLPSVLFFNKWNEAQWGLSQVIDFVYWKHSTISSHLNAVICPNRKSLTFDGSELTGQVNLTFSESACFPRVLQNKNRLNQSQSKEMRPFSFQKSCVASFSEQQRSQYQWSVGWIGPTDSFLTHHETPSQKGIFRHLFGSELNLLLL